MRVLLSGGGTAGHINPAIAIADMVKQNNKDAKIAFVGTEHGMENQLVAAAGYPMYHVQVEGFSRSLSPANLRALWLAATSPHKAKAILTDFCPDLVIGTGGYVCWPLLRAAAAMKIPCALHESNAMPGLSARRLAPYMDAIWLNFAETANFLPRGCVTPVCTGNPLRENFGRIPRKEAKRRLGISEDGILLLSFGGSLGAERLNEAMIRFMKEDQKELPGLWAIHACGSKHYGRCRANFGKDREKSKLLPYIESMPLYMAAADILVCRAGALTLSEIARCGRCAILVPSPYVTDDHQRKNAAVFVKKQAAFLLEESDLPENKLKKMIFSLVLDNEKRAFTEKMAKTLEKVDCNKIILSEISKIAR